MKTCKQFFHKSLIITDAEALKSCKAEYYGFGYGFCLLSFPINDCRAQRIYRFTDKYDAAISWLMKNDLPNCAETFGVILGSNL